jgi:hypothetical protein
MKFPTFVLLLCIIGLAMVFTIYGSYRSVNHYPEMRLTNAYESFQNNSLGYASTNETIGGGVGANDAVNSAIASTDGCKKVAGFQGIYCGATQEPGNPVDIFSTAEGSPNCVSMGYSNSRGYLCMDAAQKQLLTSRGGNASGK